MSRYPSATWRPITGTETTPIRKDILCLHTMVGGMASTWSYFNRTDIGVYSHLLVGGIWGSDVGKNLDGTIWQIADTNYRAAANLDGNPYIISVETADNGVRPIVPWTAAQCDAIVRIMVDAHRIDGIPLVLVPDSKPGRRGIAYHRLGCDPYRVADGDHWSSSYGKDCPTQVRIDQIPGLIARANAIVNAPTVQEDELNDTDKKWLTAEIHRVTLRTMLAVVSGGPNSVVPASETEGLAKLSVKAQIDHATGFLMYGDASNDAADPGTHPDNLQRIRKSVETLSANVAAMSAKLDALVTPPAPPSS